MKKLIIPKQIVCADSDNRILNNSVLEITGNTITGIREYNKKDINEFNGEILNAENLTLIPGFIQTHIHLCQTLFRGLADDLELLDWLQQKIFPFENALDKSSLKVSIQIGINELVRGGTTTILDMGTLRHQEIIFEELIDSGLRAFAGKCMIDKNDLYTKFKSTTREELESVRELAGSFHSTVDGKIKYGFAPRFVLTSTEELLKETKEIMKDFPGSIFHTHSSENKNETAEVRKRFKMENIEYFDSLDLIDEHTVLAHCIHINENEIDILKNRKARIAHCPSSNLKLGSGIANVPRLLKEGISVSLGSDGAPCNNNLSAFTEMKLASLIQKPFHGPSVMNAQTIFRMATIEAAKALHLENEVGSIEEGKKADLALLNLETPFHPLGNEKGNIYSKIVYSASKDDVIHVMIDGEWVVRDRVSLKYDVDELYHHGKEELNKLLKRVGNA